MDFRQFWISDGVEKKPLGGVEEFKTDAVETQYCVVSDSGLCYPMYDEWINRNFYAYKDDFIYEHDGEDIKPDRLYRVIGHAPHLDDKKTELYLIQDTDTEQVFIIERKGILITTTTISVKNTNTIYCDDNLDATQYTYNIRGGERNMDNRILDLYAERAKEKIKKEYETIVNNDYDKLDVVKEYNELVSTFNTSLAEMANRYNNEENTYLHRTGYELTPMYELSDDIEANIRKKYLDEIKERLKDIDLLVEEVRAVLGVSDTEEYRISVLKEYGIIDKKGKLSV